MPCLLSATLCASRSFQSFKESTPGCTGRANSWAPWYPILSITPFHTPADSLLLSRHFFRLPDVGCLHLIWRCLQRWAPLRGDFSSTPILKCIRSLLQSLPRSAHIEYDTHNRLSEGVGANCPVSQPKTKPLQIICLLFDSAWLESEPSPMHARRTLCL